MKLLLSLKKKLTIPDWLSIYRIVSAPFLIAFIFLDYRLLFSSFLLISFLTDAVDGYLARRMNVVSQRGAQLDSIGDAITFIVGLAGIARFETAFIIEHSWLIMITFGLYILQLVMAYWRYGMPSSFHTYLAKLSAILQGTFMLWLLFMGVELWLFYVAVAFSIIETIEEIILIFIFSKWKANVKGLYWVLNKRK
jgi:phosphatidylglycerophosphate synthase